MLRCLLPVSYERHKSKIHNMMLKLPWMGKKKAKCCWTVRSTGAYTANGENAKWWSHFGKQFGKFLVVLGTPYPFASTIPLLSIYSREIKIYPYKVIYILMFLASLFIISQNKYNVYPLVIGQTNHIIKGTKYWYLE